MKRILLAAALLAALTGCGAGSAFDTQYKIAFRKKGVDSCVQKLSATPAAATLNAAQICACAIDHVMAGKSATELMRLSPSDPTVRAQAQQCFAQAHTGAG